MTEFTIHTLESAPESARPILEMLKDRVGFVPNVAATMAGSPPVLEAFVGLQSSNAHTAFSPVEREIISMAASYDIQCTYCMAAHSTFARAQGASEAVLNAVRSGKEPDDKRLAGLTRFTHQVVRNGGEVSTEDIRAFLGAGFTQPQLLEVLIGVSQVRLVSLVHQMAGMPLDAGFQPQAWAAAS
jgi:uncharacterized peroxidase-related enzyme